MAHPGGEPPGALHVRDVLSLILRAVHHVSDPYRWPHSLAAQIQGAAILTRTGDGHTSYYTSECARTASDQYLIRPQASPDRTCEG
jgi:hypothetical protein